MAETRPQAIPPTKFTKAEQTVLDLILIRMEMPASVTDPWPEDFYREAHGRIFQSRLDIADRRERKS